MIENYQQYQVTKQQFEKFEKSLKELENKTPDSNVHPLLWQAQIDGMRSMRDDLRAELQEYKAKYKQQVLDAYELLGGGFIEGHLFGVRMLEQVERKCPEALREVDAEIERNKA